MKPVYQKVFDAGKGDCWRACIASVLELDVDSVPNFVGDSDHSKGIIAEDLAKKWLAERGLFIIEVFLYDREWDLAIHWHYLLNSFCIMSVPSQRFPGGSHAVVGQFVRESGGTELRIVHDPNPANEPYPEDVPIKRLQFLANYVPILKT
jgi:hypothetical protein